MSYNIAWILIMLIIWLRIGGCDPRETVKTNRYIAERSCFKLDLRNSQWSKLPDMKYARFDHAAVLFHEQLFVIGGQDENGKLVCT